jgi:DNA-binding PadR family transcriptional regulator
LRRLEKAGLLESSWDEKSGRINRRIYTLSESGKFALIEGRKMVENQLIVLNEMKTFYDNHFIKRESDENI